MQRSTSSVAMNESGNGPICDMPGCPLHVGFSNRPFWVKHFQAIHHQGVDVARGLALLFGIGTAALSSWGSKARWNNLLGGLAVRRTAGPSRHTNSPHPSSREGHHSTTGWSTVRETTGLIRFITRRFSAMPQPPRPLASSDQPMAPGTCDPVAGVDRGRLMARRRD